MVMVMGLPTLHREGQETLAWDSNSSSLSIAKIALEDAELYAEMKDWLKVAFHDEASGFAFSSDILFVL